MTWKPALLALALAAVAAGPALAEDRPAQPVLTTKDGPPPVKPRLDSLRISIPGVF